MIVWPIPSGREEVTRSDSARTALYMYDVLCASKALDRGISWHTRMGPSMSTDQRPRAVIRIEKSLIGPAQPRLKTVRTRQVQDYPGVAAAHLEAARRLSSPLLMGPPICDELLAFVQHTFTEEEAAVVSVLRPLRGRTAAEIAGKLRRPPEDVQVLLDQLALQKRAISCNGPDEKRQYRLIPIMPGIFEMVLIGQSPETLNDWHRRFAELFEALFETGYTLDYQDRPAPLFRFLPVGRVAGSHPMAVPLRPVGSGARPLQGVRGGALPMSHVVASHGHRLRAAVAGMYRHG